MIAIITEPLHYKNFMYMLKQQGLPPEFLRQFKHVNKLERARGVSFAAYRVIGTGVRDQEEIIACIERNIIYNTAG